MAAQELVRGSRNGDALYRCAGEDDMFEARVFVPHEGRKKRTYRCGEGAAIAKFDRWVAEVTGEIVLTEEEKRAEAANRAYLEAKKDKRIQMQQEEGQGNRAARRAKKSGKTDALVEAAEVIKEHGRFVLHPEQAGAYIGSYEPDDGEEAVYRLFTGKAQMAKKSYDVWYAVQDKKYRQRKEQAEASDGKQDRPEEEAEMTNRKTSAKTAAATKQAPDTVPSGRAERTVCYALMGKGELGEKPVMVFANESDANDMMEALTQASSLTSSPVTYSVCEAIFKETV